MIPIITRLSQTKYFRLFSEVYYSPQMLMHMVSHFLEMEQVH